MPSRNFILWYGDKLLQVYLQVPADYTQELSINYIPFVRCNYLRDARVNLRPSGEFKTSRCIVKYPCSLNLLIYLILAVAMYLLAISILSVWLMAFQVDKIKGLKLLLGLYEILLAFSPYCDARIPRAFITPS
jgi:hypothetical protein